MNQTETRSIRLERSNHIAWITFNRPEKHNALTSEMMDNLPKILAEVAEDKGIRAVVLSGVGKSFCAGGDLQTTIENRSNPKEERIDQLYQRCRASLILDSMPKPTIAMIDGVAAGAGFSLALACTFRIATDRAKFVPAFSKIGVPGDFGVTYFLPRLTNLTVAQNILMRNISLSAEKGAALGLIDKMVGEEDLLESTRHFVDDLLRAPPIALAAIKENLRECSTKSLNQCIMLEAEKTVELLETDDSKEAIQAFLEKREPKFSGN